MAQHGCIFGVVLIDLQFQGAFVIFLESALLTVYGAIEVTFEVLVKYTIQIVLHTAQMLPSFYEMVEGGSVSHGVSKSTTCGKPASIYKHM